MVVPEVPGGLVQARCKGSKQGSTEVGFRVGPREGSARVPPGPAFIDQAGMHLQANKATHTVGDITRVVFFWGDS